MPKPSERIRQIGELYPDFYSESYRLIRIEAKLQAIIEYLDNRYEEKMNP